VEVVEKVMSLGWRWCRATVGGGSGGGSAAVDGSNAVTISGNRLTGQ